MVRVRSPLVAVVDRDQFPFWMSVHVLSSPRTTTSACSVMPVHRALLTEDILDEIFNLNFTNRLTLASLARVCTVFHEPAIRSLWRLLPKLSAIISLIPSCHVQTLEDVGPQNEAMVNNEHVRHSSSVTPVKSADHALPRNSRMPRCANGAGCANTLATFGIFLSWIICRNGNISA